MKQNSCSLDQLLKGQSSYFNGDNLWKRALECKRILLNEIHTVFCQEVCPRWPTLPIKAMLDESGDLMNDEEKSDLRKQLLILRKKSLSMAASDDGSG